MAEGRRAEYTFSPKNTRESISFSLFGSKIYRLVAFSTNSPTLENGWRVA